MQFVTPCTENKFALRGLACGVSSVLEIAMSGVLKIKSSQVVPKRRIMKSDS